MPAEGTRLRGKTWWYVTSERRDGTGERYKRWRRAVADGKPNTQAGAKSARLARLRWLEQGVQPTRQTITQLVTRHIAQRPNLRPASRYTYTTALKRAIAPYLGARAASDLTRADVRAWHQQLLAAGYAPETIKQAHTLLSGALQTAMNDDELPRNVARLERPPRVPKPPEPPAWSAQRIEHFLTVAATDEQDGALWAVLALTGVRISEAVTLRWEDCDLSDLATAAIIVRATGSRTDTGARMVGPPKSDAGVRRIALPPDATLALRDHRDRQAFTGVSPWLFPGINGGPLAASTAVRRLHRFCARHALPDCTPHELRHVQASWLLELRVNPKAILTRMGWTRLALLDRYARLMPGAADALADTLAASLDAARQPPVDDAVAKTGDTAP